MRDVAPVVIEGPDWVGRDVSPANSSPVTVPATMRSTAPIGQSNAVSICVFVPPRSVVCSPRSILLR
jgi:hypothetical protein